MWKLIHISARDVCSFRDLQYSPQQGVTTLIFGHNADNENQQSNGSGKSTLIEAIALGITGTPLRKVRTEEIINDVAAECSVQLSFFNVDTLETLIIARDIYRKGSSTVKITLKDEETEKEVAQASVDAANKYILEKLGITKDELYGSFILSKHRYQDFLSSPDKEKKEIINRFSNGILVDHAIQKLGEDVAPLREELHEADLEFAGIEGRIDMLTDQIHREEESKEDNERSRAEKVAGIKQTISEKKSVIQECEGLINICAEKTGSINALDGQVQHLENDDETLDDCISALGRLLVPTLTPKLTDWSEIIATKKREVENSKKEIDKWTTIIGSTTHKIGVAQKDLIAVSKECEIFEEQAAEKYEEIKSEMEELAERQDADNQQIDLWKRRKRTLMTSIERLEAQIAGTVTCPACSHQFLISDNDFDVDAANVELTRQRTELETAKENLLDNEIDYEKAGQMLTHLNNELRALASQKEEWIDKLKKARRGVEAAEYEMEGYKFNLKRIQDFVAERQVEIDDIRRNIFDEAYDVIDAAHRTNERMITEQKEKISAAESSIDTLRQTIDDIEKVSATEVIDRLKASLKEYRVKSSEMMDRISGLKKRLASLEEQEQLFGQFKGYLANTKINALSAMMNQVLVDLGSDLRVNLSGYTTLKSGTVREKISVSIIRDGVDAGSFAKFSEGEKSRVNIASIVAMQRLVNANCDLGKGLDFLAIDELADAMDFDGLASVFSTLNKIGVTAMVVSHGLTSESYPHRITVFKENGESRIE